MIPAGPYRVPLRPLTRILDARAKGENPDAIERENIRVRHEAQADRLRQRAESRLLVLAICFLGAFFAVALRMTTLAAAEPEEPRVAGATVAIATTRADIVDVRGRILATNLSTSALYAHPHEIVDARAAADGLAAIFPDIDADALHARLADDGRRFIWIRRSLSPEQRQRVHDLGEPGLLFGPREMRLYPNGPLAAHVLGGAGFGEEGVNAAQIVGRAGIEAHFDDLLSDPGREGPLRLSLDLSVQAAVEEVLAGGMMVMGARAAAAILMEADTGRIVSLASLPDFDPNQRPQPDPEDLDGLPGPRFNHAVQGLYELGSTFKIFTVAQALDQGMVTPQTMIDTRGPLRMAGFAIRDFHYYGPEMSVEDIIVRSSNIGTARIALDIGAEAQERFLTQLGLLSPLSVELVEAAAVRPQQPANWGQLSTMTISYGHGVATSPLHLAAGYAAIVNGGRRVSPTLLAEPQDPATLPQSVTSADPAPADAAAPGPVDAADPGPAVISSATSATARAMLRAVVTRGTASFARVEGYALGGKTGTADMPRADGRGYHDDRTVTTFAAAFPMDDPVYVLVVTLIEPSIYGAGQERRTAGWTAVPVAAEIVRRAAPLLGLRPYSLQDMLPTVH